MSRMLAIVFAVLLVVLVAAGTVRTERLLPATSPQAAVQSLFDRVKSRNFDGAYSYVAPASNVEKDAFVRDLNGRDGSLRTYSNLADVQTKVLRETPSEALVRTHLTWSTAVGPLKSSRDLKVVKHEGNWKVLWQAEKRETPPPQVIPVNYLRWDIIRRGADDEWGSQNVEAPRVRIVSMNAVERDGNVIVMGELVNEDTVPAFVSVSATLLDEKNQEIAEESSFDKIQHTLLPKEVSPYRIDFSGIKIEEVKNVRMQPNALLVPASADPVIGVMNQRIEKDSSGRPVLRGELLNQSGMTVNIPHVLATYYDDSGSVIWVSDGYVDDALLPQTPVPFSVEVRDELAKNVHSYRVSVNHYSTVTQ
jgi:hypothetical protein